MTFGAIVAAVAGDAFLTNQVGWLGGLASGAIVAGLIYLLIVIGKLTVTCLNAYGSFMCAATITTAVTGRRTMGSNARVAFVLVMLALSMCIALWASADFLDNFKNFVLLLLMVFTPVVGDQPHRLLPRLQGAGRPAGALRPERAATAGGTWWP